MNYLTMVDKIEYGDTGKQAREKINWIIDEVYASIPSIWENWHWYIWWVDTWIMAVWAKLRNSNNLIKQNEFFEIFTDLQLADWLTPTSTFPVWVCVWYVWSNNGRATSWVLLNAKTENWNYIRLLYWDDKKLYIDWWRWTFKSIAMSDEIVLSINQLRSELSRVAFTGLSSDLINDASFNSMPVLSKEEFDNLWPITDSDDKRYVVFKEIRKS